MMVNLICKINWPALSQSRAKIGDYGSLLPLAVKAGVFSS